MNQSPNLLRIVATNLPENSIRPLVPTAQSLQNFFQQKTHLGNSQKTTFLRPNWSNNSTHEQEKKGKSQSCWPCIFKILTTTAGTSSSLFGSQSSTSLSVWIQVNGVQFPACHSPDEQILERESRVKSFFLHYAARFEFVER